MRILIAAHKNPHDPNPRGGETSVRILADYLKEKGHTLAIWCYGDSQSELQSLANDSDIILTWGKAAPQVPALGKPYILMVRFWRNVQPLPVGDLLNDAIDDNFQREKQPLFSNAKAVITNNHYSAKVLKRIYEVDAVVSYVPIIKVQHVLPGGQYLTIITPEIYGEYELVQRIGILKQDWKFLIVNPLDSKFDGLQNCRVYQYLPISEILSQTQILLTPTYHHDICGTRRTPIEAMSVGIPTITNDRSGITEKVKNSVPRDATVDQWITKISYVKSYYTTMQSEALEAFEEYNTPKQLARIEYEINRG